MFSSSGKIITWGGRSTFYSVQGADITGELRDLSIDIAKGVPRERGTQMRAVFLVAAQREII